MQQMTISTYKFSELSEEAQEKAIQDMYSINTEFEWWLMDDSFYYFGQEDYGIEINMRRIGFDLDRGSYVYFDTHDHGRTQYEKPAIKIVDYKKFLEKAGFDLRKVKHLVDEVCIDTQHYSGGFCRNIIDCSTATGEEDEKLQECLNTFFSELLKQLHDEYEALTEREAIIDTIEASEYDFLEDGSRAYHI